jgi:hypothetical protein
MKLSEKENSAVQAIQANPGIHMSELARLLKERVCILSTRLHRLEQHGFVHSVAQRHLNGDIKRSLWFPTTTIGGHCRCGALLPDVPVTEISPQFCSIKCKESEA